MFSWLSIAMNKLGYFCVIEPKNLKAISLYIFEPLVSNGRWEEKNPKKKN
jgi:hypothetical protein